MSLMLMDFRRSAWLESIMGVSTKDMSINIYAPGLDFSSVPIFSKTP